MAEADEEDDAVEVVGPARSVRRKQAGKQKEKQHVPEGTTWSERSGDARCERCVKDNEKFCWVDEVGLAKWESLVEVRPLHSVPAGMACMKCRKRRKPCRLPETAALREQLGKAVPEQRGEKRSRATSGAGPSGSGGVAEGSGGRRSKRMRSAEVEVEVGTPSGDEEWKRDLLKSLEGIRQEMGTTNFLLSRVVGVMEWNEKEDLDFRRKMDAAIPKKSAESESEGESYKEAEKEEESEESEEELEEETEEEGGEGEKMEE